MQFTQSQAYENGLSAHRDFQLPVLPPWAKMLSCDHGSFYLFTPIQAFMRDTPCVSQSAEHDGHVYIEVFKAPGNLGAYHEFLETIEESGLHMSFYAPTLDLECHGGTACETIDGQFFIAGVFTVIMGLPSTEHKVRYEFKGRLHFPRYPGCYHLTDPSYLCPPFTVVVEATMDRTFACATNRNIMPGESPFFGFFENFLENEETVTKHTHTTKPGRLSQLTKYFKS